MTSIDRDDRNPVDDLADLFDSLDGHVHTANRNARLDEGNRLTLLFGHGVFGALVSPGFALMAKTGMESPSFVVLREVPGAPISLAVWVGAAGMTLAVATYFRCRLVEYVALAALALWYLTTFASYAGAIALWIAEPGPLDWAHAPTTWALWVYAGYTFALGAHMRTLRRKGLRRDAQ